MNLAYYFVSIFALMMVLCIEHYEKKQLEKKYDQLVWDTLREDNK